MTRVALVTGAGRGIGAATVAELCRQGYAVTALDVCSGGLVPPGIGYPMANREQLDAVARAFPDRVLTVEADVRDREALESAVDATLVRFGRLDAVVAAAGVVAGGLLQWDTPDEHLETLFDVNVHGVWNTAAVTVPVMLGGPSPSQCRFVAVASAIETA